MMQSGFFWQDGQWQRGVWLDKEARPIGSQWLRPHYFWMGEELATADETIEELVPIGDLPGWTAGLRSYDTPRGPAIFRLRAYVERFLTANPAIEQIYPVETQAHLRQAISQTVLANGYCDSHIRPVPIYTAAEGDTSQFALGIIVTRWQDLFSQADQREGIALKTRPDKGHMTLAAPQQERTYTNDHLLAVQDGKLCALNGARTPESLTRDTVLALAQDAGIPVQKGAITWADVQTADELIVCSAAAEVLGVREIDGRAVHNGRVGPITRRLQELYAAATVGQDGDPRQWLDYLVLEPTI